jgi:thioredoxin 1
MENTIFLRLLMAVAIILIGAIVYISVSRVILAKARRNSGKLQTGGRPALLYFTTPDCVPCRTVQRPAVQKVRQFYGEAFQVVEINAHEQPDVARDWGVLSVPTTFILDRNGKPRHVNHGVTPAEKLILQLQSAI